MEEEDLWESLEADGWMQYGGCRRFALDTEREGDHNERGRLHEEIRRLWPENGPKKEEGEDEPLTRHVSHN